MNRKQLQYEIAINKELWLAEKQETSLSKAASKSKASWRTAVEEKVPYTVYTGLQDAFCKAFETVFEKGYIVIEKTFNPNTAREKHNIMDIDVKISANRRAIKKIRKTAKNLNVKNSLFSGAEGIGLGVLGIGLPDIVIFVATLIKGIYQTALHYGFEYSVYEEQYFILKLMETAMAKGDDWTECNDAVDDMIENGIELTDKSRCVKNQITKTAHCFAVDMVALKFIQGMPVVGVVGGAANSVYYNRVMKYAEVKYRKRYLLGLKKDSKSG